MTTPNVALGSLLTDIRPGFASGDDLAEGIFQIRMNNLSQSGELLLDKRRRVSPDAKQIPRTLLEPGDVLFNATNSPELVGKTALFFGCDEPAVFSNHFIRLRTHEDWLDSRYLTRWLQREFQRGYFRAKAKQWVNQATFSQDRLVQMQIPLPPIEEQRRIAAVLDAAEALRVKRRQALARLDSLTQAIFADMFSGESFELVALGDVGDFKYGTSEKAAATGVATLRIPNVVGGEISYEDIKQVPVTEEELSRLQLVDGDLLFVRSNGNPDYVGRSAVFSRRDADHAGFADPVIFASYLIRARLREELANSTFVSAFLNGPEGRRALRRRCKTSAGQYNINTQGLGSVPLPLPPVPAQHKFSQRTRLVRDRVEVCYQQLGQLDALFASLQQRAFRGEL